MFSGALATMLGDPRATAQLPSGPAVPVEEECPTPTPSPTTTETPDEVTPPEEVDDPLDLPEDECDDDDDDDGDGDGRDDDGKGKDRDDKKGRPDQNDRRDQRDRRNDRGRTKKDPGKNPKRKSDGKHKKRSKTKKKNGSAGSASSRLRGPLRATGDFDTDRLQLIAAKLKARGFDEDRVISLVYRPFLIAGPAAWTDTWGAPRYGPGPIVRTHEGQDVFCRYGDPVLATEAGEIEFDEGGLGGIVARLYRPDGSYWYYAHLSDVNDRDFKNGDAVEAGDVIGYCGNTGNAITTPPHVHFGWYQANGESRDPMGYLIRWLRTAERNAAAAYKRATGHSIATIEQDISSRRFGDSFAPDISELKVSSQSLLAIGASPGSSALGLAEAALQAALAEQGEVPGSGIDYGGGAGHSESRIAELLEATSASPSGPAGD